MCVTLSPAPGPARADSLPGMSEPATETTLRRRQNTRARLIAAAEDVFTAKGLRRVTVDDLVGAAGFSRGAFYSNFSSIEEVFYALFRAQSEQMLDTVRTLLDETPDDEFSIGLLLARLRPLSRSWYVIQTEFTLLALRSEEARVVFREHRADFEDQMVSVIADVLDRLGTGSGGADQAADRERDRALPARPVPGGPRDGHARRRRADRHRAAAAPAWRSRARSRSGGDGLGRRGHR